MEPKDVFTNSKAADMGEIDTSGSEENGQVLGIGRTIKRDLRRRHINMIALAGMIVSKNATP